ncbi:MAG TPA: hypothetical protein VH678_31285 [Xanthobacteraceae bacterium]|jgi:hypothetical protein
MNNDNLLRCYEHAAFCRELALRQADPLIRDDYLDLARSWLLLAESYQLAYRALSAIDAITQRRRGRGAARTSVRNKVIAELLRRAHEPLPTGFTDEA